MWLQPRAGKALRMCQRSATTRCTKPHSVLPYHEYTLTGFGRFLRGLAFAVEFARSAPGALRIGPARHVAPAGAQGAGHAGRGNDAAQPEDAALWPVRSRLQLLCSKQIPMQQSEHVGWLYIVLPCTNLYYLAHFSSHQLLFFGQHVLHCTNVY